MMNEMTAKEAVKILKDERDHDIFVATEYREKLHEALDKAINALEQQSKPMEKFDDVKTHIQRLAGDYKCWDNRLTWEETLELNRMLEAQPSEDCISREAVKNGMIKYGFHAPDMTVTEFVEDCLPSVIPQRKNGKWIFKQFDEETGISDSYWCSECNHPLMSMYKEYCPNCGAEMSGGGEE